MLPLIVVQHNPAGCLSLLLFIQIWHLGRAESSQGQACCSCLLCRRGLAQHVSRTEQLMLARFNLTCIF